MLVMNINNIVTEMRTVANADTAIRTFIYGDPSDINSTRNNGYPCLLVDRNLSARNVNILKGKATYVVKLFFYDLFQNTEAAQKNDQQFQQSLELVINNYIKELYRRCKETFGNQFQIQNYEALRYEFAFRKASDNLQQITVDLEIYCNIDCTDGIFDYS